LRITSALVLCLSLSVLGVPIAFADADVPAASTLLPESASQRAADLAESYAGSPYAWGGASPAGFDCSGLVMWVYQQFGVEVAHVAEGALSVGTPVERDALRPGDVLVFGDTYRSGPSHAGIYLGDGRFVHAVDEAHGVMVSSLESEYWSAHYQAAARLLDAGDTPESGQTDVPAAVGSQG
jgi:cell wall-associated NlpC family hydrolase